MVELFKIAETALTNLLDKHREIPDAPRAVLCIHCGKAIHYEDFDKDGVYASMRRHEIICPENPLGVVLRALVAAVGALPEDGAARVQGLELNQAYGRAVDLLWSVGDQE